MREGDWTYGVYFSKDGPGRESVKPPEKPDMVEQSLPEPRSLNMSPSGPVHCQVQSSQATL
jgi:hypothetical protein